jgi:hypothetical protein
MVCKITDVNLQERLPGLEDWQQALAADPISQKVAADTGANRAGFFSPSKGVAKYNTMLGKSKPSMLAL